ncbi:MAG: hypothetical protein IKK32_01040, partial [Oscillospiraceae bacterium]|nr:hypothetical protein [Oscillospiraceae bacterium]
MKKHCYIISLMTVIAMMFSGCTSEFFPLEENPYKQTETEVSVSETVPTYFTEPFTPIETTEETTSETTETTEFTTTYEETTTPETTVSTTVPTTVSETTTVTTTTPAVTETAQQTTKTMPSVSLSSPDTPRKEIYRSYVYNTLTEKEKQAYDIFEGAAVSLSNKADFEGLSLTKEELEKVVYAFDLYE